MPDRPARVKAENAPSDLREVFVTTDRDLAAVLALQVAATLGDVTGGSWIHDSTRAAVRSVGARDGVEDLLAVQMVGVHNLAMRAMANAAAKGQSAQGFELYTNCANRLLRTYSAQVEALKTYRSKGEQKVAVEHVHVHRGGQAIVGPVNHSATGGGGGDDQKD